LEYDWHRGSGQGDEIIGEVTATVAKLSPKISQEIGKDRKYRKAWKEKWLRKIGEFSRNAGRKNHLAKTATCPFPGGNTGSNRSPLRYEILLPLSAKRASEGRLKRPSSP
jgi:hypothetical protein